MRAEDLLSENLTHRSFLLSAAILHYAAASIGVEPWVLEVAIERKLLTRPLVGDKTDIEELDLLRYVYAQRVLDLVDDSAWPEFLRDVAYERAAELEENAQPEWDDLAAIIASLEF